MSLKGRPVGLKANMSEDQMYKQLLENEND